MTGAPRKAAQSKHVLDVFQPRTDRPLSGEDARTISQNLVGFFALLGEWASRGDRTAPPANAAGAGGKADQLRDGLRKKQAKDSQARGST